MRSLPPPGAPSLPPTSALRFARFDDVPRRVKLLIYLLSFLTMRQGFYITSIAGFYLVFR